MEEKLDRKKIEEKIINFLKQTTHGATGSEIAKYLGMNRVTVSKYLDVLRAEGLIDYKQIGRTKIWFLNEDIAILELIRSEKDILKFIRRDSKTNTLHLGGEISIFFAPTELIADIYLEIIKMNKNKYKEILENIGARLGKQYTYVYEMYGGVKIAEMPEKSIESIILQISRFFLNKGWGALKDLVYNHKKKELIVVVENSIIYEALREIEDPIIQELEGKPVCFMLAGFFRGIMEGIFNQRFKAEETKCLNQGEKYCEFVIKL